jgi:NH3-dependent NAD+ synthetase
MRSTDKDADLYDYAQTHALLREGATNLEEALHGLFVIYEIQRVAVAQLVEILRYKPEGRESDFRWGHCNFSVT